ncbi:MAG: multicopper oxidase family protein [Bryobacteraceae bacterium]
MSNLTRRDFLAGTAGGSLTARRVRATNSTGLIELDLQPRQDWIRIGGRDAFAYAFNGMVPGPLIEAYPGDSVRITFRNLLSEPTNLHFHGLHIPPTGTADNVMLEMPRGESFVYDFQIPVSHPGGTFWYHPHLHGSVARQVSRGLAGVFIVRGELDQIPEIAAAPEHVLVLQDFDFNAGGLPAEPSLMEQMTGRTGDLITVSGSLNPAIPILSGGWVRLRILNASSSRFYRLTLEEHPLVLIATDGGAIGSPREHRAILLAPGERIEVMVQGAKDGGAYRLLHVPYPRDGAMASYGPVVLATLRYEGVSENPWRLPERLVSVQPLAAPSVRRTFVLGSGAAGPGIGMGMRGMAFTINGRLFDSRRVDTRARLNNVEEWEFINSSSMDHPMHLHTNPFQVAGADGTPELAWKDVVLVPAGSRVRIRTALLDFSGETMYHCHILDHEDLGMMGLMEIARDAPS